MSSSHQKRAGFTILEVLVTIVILTIALWALSSLQTVSVATNYNSRRITIATILAQDKLEELRGLDWDDSQLSDTSGNFTLDQNDDGVTDYFDWSAVADHINSDGPGSPANPIDENGEAVVSGSSNEGYTRTWNIVDNAPGANMKTISVRVQWQEKKGRSVTIDTVITKN